MCEQDRKRGELRADLSCTVCMCVLAFSGESPASLRNTVLLHIRRENWEINSLYADTNNIV